MPGSQSFCRRSLPGWQTTFGRWVGDIGVPGIVLALKPDPDLRVTPNCVYQWLLGHQPRPARAQALVDMSAGQLTLDAVYGHIRELRELRNAVDQRIEKNP